MPGGGRHSRASRPEGQVQTEVWRHQERKGKVTPSHTLVSLGPSCAQAPHKVLERLRKIGLGLPLEALTHGVEREKGPSRQPPPASVQRTVGIGVTERRGLGPGQCGAGGQGGGRLLSLSLAICGMETRARLLGCAKIRSDHTWPVATAVPDALWPGPPQLSLLFPGSAQSPAGMAPSTGITPALDPRPRHPCRPASASTCPSQPQCRAAGPDPAPGRGLPVRHPARKSLLQTWPCLVLLWSGPSPGPPSSLQLPGFRSSCLGSRKAQPSPVMFFNLPVWAAGWLQEGWIEASPLGELGPAARGTPLGWIAGRPGPRLGLGRWCSGPSLLFYFASTGRAQAHLCYHQGKGNLRFCGVRPRSVGLQAMPCCIDRLPLTRASGSGSGPRMETPGPMQLPSLP